MSKPTRSDVLRTVVEIVICGLIFIPGVIACLCIWAQDLHTNNPYLKPLYVAFIIVACVLICMGVVTLMEPKKTPNQKQ